MTTPTTTPPALRQPANRIRRWFLPALMLLTLVVGLLGAIRLGLSLGEPFPGFVLLWRKEYKLLTVSYATPPNWSGPAAGMWINDRILCIDGYSPKPDSPVYGLDPRYAEHPCLNGQKNYAAIFRDASLSDDPTIDFFIDRGGELKTVRNVPLVRFTVDLLLETFAPTFILGLMLIGLGWVVCRANPDYEINLVFSSIMVIASNFAFNTALAGHITDRQFETGMVTMVQVVPWVALLGPLIFHLADLLSNPGPLSSISRLMRRPYYSLAVIFSVIGVIAYLFNNSQFSQTLNLVYLIWIATSWLFSTVWALTSLGLAYRRVTLRRVRNQTGWVLAALVVSAVIGFPFMFLFFSNQAIFPYMQGMPYLGLVGVGMISYAILRYQLFSARHQTLTIILVLVTGVLAALIVYLPVGQEISFVPLLGSSLLAGSVFAGRFKPLRFLDRLLHQEELNYQVAAQFSQRIHQPHNVKSLVDTACAALKGELEAEQVALFWLCIDQPALEHYLDSQPVGSQALDPALAAHVEQLEGPVYAQSQAGQVFMQCLSGIVSVLPNGLWVPLTDRNKALGLLYIGPRWTGEIYNEDDLRLVRLMTVQFSLALANTCQVEQLRSMQHLILLADENERSKIARELHDTVLQFLPAIMFGLDRMKENPHQISEQIEVWQERISSEAGRLRDLLNYLRTPETLEQRGLTTSLDQLFEDMRRQTTTRLEWEVDPAVDLALAPDTKVALYRMLREAVHNALKHARARRVAIQLKIRDGRAIFFVDDDGQGFEINPALKASEKGYSSLQDMSIYIESTGGKLEIQSAPGQGTSIRGWTPTLPVN